MSRYRIAAVCLGNICRSPMAEAVIRSYLADSELAADVTVDSGGTQGWHEGDPPDPRALATLRAHGYPLNHRGQRVDATWWDRTDLFLAMDASNYDDLMAIAPSRPAEVRMMRSFDPALAGRVPGDPGLDVPDPYYGDDAGFERVLAMLESSAAGLVAELRDRLYPST